jgi:FAD/FMN-containing dehydrogenase
MPDVSFRTRDGATRTIGGAALDALRSELRGAVCLAGDPGYDEARAVWNAMVDRRPAAIVRASTAEDVVAAIRFAREQGVVLAVRGGGHNIAGNAVCEGGLMLDLTPMKGVRVDAAGRLARVEPGVTLGELDRATQAHGLATPVGINSTTGVAGLTLGGGFGWLSRKHGLTIDNLVAAEVVTADGERLRASDADHPDLFWAIRGAGANFGVVTLFEYRLHRVGPEVLSGLVVHRLSDARELLGDYRRLAAQAPEELSCWVVLRKAPPLPFLPAEVHGTEVLVLAACHAGDLDRGREAIAPFQRLGRPLGEAIGPTPFVGWQAAFDPMLTPGARNYWKSHNFLELSDGAIGAVLAAVQHLPTPECEVFIGQLGGAVNRVSPAATAYPHRDVNYVMNIHTRWTDPGDDRRCISWARGLFDELAPHATGGVYVNFMPEDEGQRVSQGAYGANYDRLTRLKARYDPDNLFRLNQNIPPADLAGP